MEATYRRYPIGIQNFEDLRNNNCCAYEKTGRKAVVLIDGYDSPYLHHKDLDVRMKFRNVLSEIFCPIKGCGKYLQFVLMTGVEYFNYGFCSYALFVWLFDC